MLQTTLSKDYTTTARRQTRPRQAYTPTQRTPPPTYYLLFFDLTESYQIVARSSLKTIDDNVATIMIHNKSVTTNVVHRGMFLYSNFCLYFLYIGTLDECNTEYARLTRLSQRGTDEEKFGDTQIILFFQKKLSILLDDLEEDDEPINNKLPMSSYMHLNSTRSSHSSPSASAQALSMVVDSPRETSDDGEFYIAYH